MLTLPLSFQPPLITNPESGWLAERQGDHTAALRLFHEACWAWAGFQSQHGRKPDEYRWSVAGSGKVIRRGFQLFDYAIKKRQQALKTGFFFLTAEQMEELLELPDLTPNQELILERFITLCDRQAETQDLYGQVLPASMREILAAIAKARPYRQQGLCALTKKIRLYQQSYFAKLTDETLSGDPPAGQDEFNEVTIHTATRTLCPEIAPASAYHIINADGQQCSLISAVPGKTYHDDEEELDARLIALLVDVTWLQWIVLVEWLLGIGDRLRGNLVIDERTKRAGIIDTTFAWKFHPTFLGWEEEDGTRTCYSFARELWEYHDPTLAFPRRLLEETFRRQSAVFAALAPFPVPLERLAALRARFAIVGKALAEHSDAIRVADIEQIAQSMVQ